jgi:hypothetical protein
MTGELQNSNIARIDGTCSFIQGLRYTMVASTLGFDMWGYGIHYIVPIDSSYCDIDFRVADNRTGGRPTILDIA